MQGIERMQWKDTCFVLRNWFILRSNRFSICRFNLKFTNSHWLIDSNCNLVQKKSYLASFSISLFFVQNYFQKQLHQCHCLANVSCFNRCLTDACNMLVLVLTLTLLVEELTKRVSCKASQKQRVAIRLQAKAGKLIWLVSSSMIVDTQLSACVSVGQFAFDFRFISLSYLNWQDSIANWHQIAIGFPSASNLMHFAQQPSCARFESCERNR